MKSKSWIVAHDGTQGRDAYAMECQRCGTVQRFAVPIEISVWCAAAKAFEREHATCRPMECPGHGRGGTQAPCCDRAGEYNGFDSGPVAFHCPVHCSCHD